MDFLLPLGAILYLCTQAVLLKYYLMSEHDIEESRSPGYIYSKYNITEDYTVDFSKIRKLKFKDGRTKKH